MRRCWFLVTVLGCATPPPPSPVALEAAPQSAPQPGSGDGARSELGPASDRYWTAPRPGGVVGGRPAEDLATLVADGLRARSGEAIAAMRKAKGVRPVARDHTLQVAAETAIRGLVAGGAPERALAAANAALVAPDRQGEMRPQPGRRGGCVQLFELLDLAQLDQHPMLLDTRARKVGVAATTLRRGSTAVLAVVAVIDGVPCH